MKLLLIITLLILASCGTLTDAQKLEIRKENQKARIQKDRN